MILIDNASLTSAQRILGEVAVPDKSTVDGDLVALENLISAILFYNELIALDDYKPEHSQARKDQFSFIRFLDPRDWDFASLKEEARSESAEMQPRIEDGEFSDDAFSEFFDLLRMNIVCTWDISSSIYYLNMKMLGQPDSADFAKYGELASSIFGELTDLKRSGAERDSSVSLLDSDGKPIGSPYLIRDAKWGKGETGGIAPALQSFLAALNWSSTGLSSSRKWRLH
ncbi:MAG: hypothetical protein K1X70_09570 [Leptospirales bacterium]|nr:hypothetical protein [Leptospirales bacterium]